MHMHTQPKRKPIPISAAERIAKQYGYDQVIIYARRITEDEGEHMTTYGRNKAHCRAIARIGNHLKFNVFLWPREKESIK